MSEKKKIKKDQPLDTNKREFILKAGLVSAAGALAVAGCSTEDTKMDVSEEKGFEFGLGGTGNIQFDGNESVYKFSGFANYTSMDGFVEFSNLVIRGQYLSGIDLGPIELVGGVFSPEKQKIQTKLSKSAKLYSSKNEFYYSDTMHLKDTVQVETTVSLNENGSIASLSAEVVGTIGEGEGNPLILSLEPTNPCF